MSTETEWRWVLRTDTIVAAGSMQRRSSAHDRSVSRCHKPQMDPNLRVPARGECTQRNQGHPGQQAYNPRQPDLPFAIGPVGTPAGRVELPEILRIHPHYKLNVRYSGQ